MNRDYQIAMHSQALQSWMCPDPVQLELFP